MHCCCPLLILYRQCGRTHVNRESERERKERDDGIDCLTLAFVDTVVLSFVKWALCTVRKQQGGRILVDVERESIRAAVDGHLRLKPIPPLLSFHFDKSHLYDSSSRVLAGWSGNSELLFMQSSISIRLLQAIFLFATCFARSSLLRDIAR